MRFPEIKILPRETRLSQFASTEGGKALELQDATGRVLLVTCPACTELIMVSKTASANPTTATGDWSITTDGLNLKTPIKHACGVSFKVLKGTVQAC